MKAAVEEVVRKALELDEEARAEVASRVLSSLARMDAAAELAKALRSSGAHSGLEEELSALAREWKAARGTSSSILKAAMHPAYQRIIGKGTAAVPFLLRQLRESPDHWFWALMAITGRDPVVPDQQGNLPQMAAAWLAWGKAEGYV